MVADRPARDPSSSDRRPGGERASDLPVAETAAAGAALPSRPVDLFAAVLHATDGRVRSPSSADEVAETIAAAAREQGSGVLYEPSGMPEGLDLPGRLGDRGIEIVEVSGAGDRVGDLRVGVTAAEMAVAETGSVIVGGEPGGWGLAAVLPWVHFVLLDPRTVHPDLVTVYRELVARMTGGRSDWVWITGPSRTADIGHTLVLGAHGPNTLEVLLWPPVEETP